MLIAHAPRKRQIVLLGKVNGCSDLDGQICPGERLVKFLPVQRATAAP